MRKEMLRRLLPIILCFAASVAFALERKASIDVNVSDLTNETQANSDAQGGMDMVWWIPIEFWAAVLAQDASMTELQRDEMLAVLGPYSILAVAQASISSFGAFRFLERDQIRDGLIIQYRYGEGRMKQTAPLEEVDPDVEILIGMMKPILTGAMGNLGRNFHFFVLLDRLTKNSRILSPYVDGEIVITLTARTPDTPAKVRFETPLNALFRPRICPNGKPAHVSWKFCPWSGDHLRD